jgi:hypothetical protein
LALRTISLGISIAYEKVAAIAEAMLVSKP